MGGGRLDCGLFARWRLCISRCDWVGSSFIVSIIAIIKRYRCRWYNGCNSVLVHELNLRAAPQHHAEIIKTGDIALQFNTARKKHRNRHLLFAERIQHDILHILTLIGHLAFLLVEDVTTGGLMACQKVMSKRIALVGVDQHGKTAPMSNSTTNLITQQSYAPWRLRLQHFVKHTQFQRFIITLIIINAITLGMETSHGLMAQWGSTLLMIDHVILGIFIVELALRLMAFGRQSFKDPWFLFDSFVVLIALAPSHSELAVLRTFRVIRVLRLISIVPSMRRVVNGLIGALSGIATVAMLMSVIFYVFSVIATKLFRDVSPEFFGSLGESMFTLFQIMTLEEWSEIARPIIAQMPYAWLFFVVYILLSTFTILNLFIGVLVNAIQTANGYEPIEKQLLHEVQQLRLEVKELKRD